MWIFTFGSPLYFLNIFDCNVLKKKKKTLNLQEFTINTNNSPLNDTNSYYKHLSLLECRESNIW